MEKKNVKIIVTLGPATHTEEDLRLFKAKGVDFVRLNMSHSTTAQLEDAILLAQKVGIPFIVDTEGSQVRTGSLQEKSITFKIGDEIRLHRTPVIGTREAINLTPDYVVGRLSVGDLLYCDFQSLVLSVFDVSTDASEGHVVARVICAGALGSNKGVYIDPATPSTIEMPPLTKKDYESIKIGLKHKVKHIAASFMRSGKAVEEVRKATKGTMQIISKVECIDGLKNLDEIIDASDWLLIDRGDLSKEIFLERIPFIQKLIVHRARRKKVPVIVATNFLESMVKNRFPTRAEIHDIESSIIDGAAGLTLAAETAIGEHPFDTLRVMRNATDHVTSVIDVDKWANKEERLVKHLEKKEYVEHWERYSPLVAPHGGVLVNRFRPELNDPENLAKLPTIQLTQTEEMDVEQIALGSYSPLQGFMSKKELISVLDKLRLPSGIIWPLPIILAISEETARLLKPKKPVLLLDSRGEPLAVLNLTEKYAYDLTVYAKKLYGTLDEKHPGVHAVLNMKPVFLAGSIDLLRRRTSDSRAHEITPAQARRLFESLGWKTVVGFHTRNVIHRGHEYIQMKALTDSGADGLFVHPVVGKKKAGDFESPYIVGAYQIMMRNFYPENKVAFGALATYSRYAGPKEALFTALIRKNFGCSHFIVGRDHTGVGDFYHPEASHKIFDKFPDLGIKPLRFGKVFYSNELSGHVHENDLETPRPEGDQLHISGTQARKLLEGGEAPPSWFMRTEISEMIIHALGEGKEVFVPHPPNATVLWLTGLSGSGKTTIANRLAEELKKKGRKVAIIDGDDVRAKYHKNLGFTEKDIVENNRLITGLIKEQLQKFDFIFVPVISPVQASRSSARELIGNTFLEVYIESSESVRKKRDPKGLYQRASTGELKNLIGQHGGVTYEIPEHPDLRVNTDDESVEASVGRLIEFLEQKKRL